MKIIKDAITEFYAKGFKDGWDKAEDIIKQFEDERKKIFELGDKKFIGWLYGLDGLDTKTYDEIVKKWEAIKKELGTEDDLK